jgi:hypothetical protein
MRLPDFVFLTLRFAEHERAAAQVLRFVGLVVGQNAAPLNRWIDASL